MNTSFTLGQLAVRFGCELHGDPDIHIRRVADLQNATDDAIGFIVNAKYLSYLETTRAGAVILSPKDARRSPIPALLATNPHATFARVASLLHPMERPPIGVHATAFVAPSAVVDATASIGPMCVIEEGVRIAANAIVGPSCVVMRDAQIGGDTHLIGRVTIGARVKVGERCVIHPGVVIGSDGFGNANEQGTWIKVPQLGSVIIGDDVEIGANSTIDRGAIGDTIIEDGVKLDNQIQIAHNVRVGAHTAMAAQVGIAGSTTIGKYCLLAGKVGVAGQLEICDRVVLMGRATVGASITKPGSYSGALGLEESRTFRRNAARFRQLDKMAKQLRRLNQHAGINETEESDDDTE